MKKLLIITLIIFLSGCVSLKKYNTVTNNLNNTIAQNQQRIQNLNGQLKESRSKLNQLGNLTVTDGTKKSDDDRAKSYRRDGSWILLEQPERYKNYLTSGLGIIWLYTKSNKYVEGGFIDLEAYKAKPDILDNGDIIFKYFVNNKFSTSISAVSSITGSLNSEDFADLKYEIMGTSRLTIPQDEIEKIAKKYAADRYSDDVVGVYLATGFHVRKISLQTFTKMSGDAVATVPVANINGEFYNESGSELYSWFVDAKLIDLGIFLPNDDLESISSTNSNPSSYELLKSVFGPDISNDALSKITVHPEILDQPNSPEFLKLFNKSTLTDLDKVKLNSISKTIIKIEKE